MNFQSTADGVSSSGYELLLIAAIQLLHLARWPTMEPEINHKNCYSSGNGSCRSSPLPTPTSAATVGNVVIVPALNLLFILLVLGLVLDLLVREATEWMHGLLNENHTSGKRSSSIEDAETDERKSTANITLSRGIDSSESVEEEGPRKRLQKH